MTSSLSVLSCCHKSSKRFLTVRMTLRKSDTKPSLGLTPLREIHDPSSSSQVVPFFMGKGKSLKG